MSKFQKVIEELHSAYQKLNQEFYDGVLPEVAVTVQSKGKRKAMGWCTTHEVWVSSDQSIRMYEINISAEFINLSFEETMNTLMHEMVHLFNIVHGVQDVSRNGTFHNKKFKEEAERRGFYYDEPADKKYGWTFAKLKPETMQRIRDIKIDESAFTIARLDLEKEKKKKKNNSYKFVCPECEDTVRATKLNVVLVCGKCSVLEEGHFVYFEEELTEDQQDQLLGDSQ